VKFEKEFLMLWWEVMYDKVWPSLSATNQQSMTSYNPFEQHQGGPINYGSLTSAHSVQVGSNAHRRDLEQGVVYPTGRDAYENIQRHMDEQIAHAPQPQSSTNGTSTSGLQSYHPSQSSARSPAPTQVIPKNEQERNVPADTSKTQTSSGEQKHVTPPPQQEKRITPPPQQEKRETSQQQTTATNVSQQKTETRQGGQASSNASSSSNQQESTRKLSTGSSEPPKRKTSTGEAPSSQAPDDIEVRQQTTGTHVTGGHSTADGNHQHSTATVTTFAHPQKK